MKTPKHIIAPILAALCWSSSYIMTNIAFESFRPITIVFFRVIIAFLFMLIIGLTFSKLDTIQKKDYKWFILLGVIEPFAYFLCETYGLTLISATLAAVILSTIPLFTPVFSSLFTKERVSFANIAGLLISLGGVILIILDGKGDLSYKTTGLLLLFGAVVVAIIYSLYVKRMAERYSEITIITIQNFVGVFLFAPLFFFIDLTHFNALPITANAIFSVIILGIVVSALAFIFYTYSLKHIGIVRTNAFLNLLPVMTAVLAYIILKEEISVQKMTGIAIVIIGLYINNIPKKKLQSK